MLLRSIMRHSVRLSRLPACGAHRSGWPSTIDWLSRSITPPRKRFFRPFERRSPKISLATVYKALEALVAIGAATRLTVSEGTGSARYDARSDNHYHFRCLRTGMVHDLPTRFDPELIARLDPGSDARPERTRFSGDRLPARAGRLSRRRAKPRSPGRDSRRM